MDAGTLAGQEVSVLENKAGAIIGKYGLIHRKYLKEHRYRLYRELSLTGKLDEHCNEVQHRAESMIEDVASKIELAEGVTEELKQSDQMEWLKRKQSIHAIAEEFVLSEVVYQI